jgi:malate dehydrogenase (oxaloacetate-decarboxylating)
VATDSGVTTISQCNNAFVFPAMGLAAVAANATRVTDSMFLAAARELAALSPARTSVRDGLLPRVGRLPDLAPRIAHAVALQAVSEGVAPKRSSEELAERMVRMRWVPEYS